MAADDGDITLRDLWNSMESMRAELSGQIGELADKVDNQCTDQRADCDTKMDDQDRQLRDHNARLARLEYIVWGMVITTGIGISLWFSHLAGVVPGIGP